MSSANLKIRIPGVVGCRSAAVTMNEAGPSPEPRITLAFTAATVEQRRAFPGISRTVKVLTVKPDSVQHHQNNDSRLCFLRVGYVASYLSNVVYFTHHTPASNALAEGDPVRILPRTSESNN